jgi:hypothetical protein
MLKQNKAYLIILSFIWPFASVMYGIKKNGERFARNLLIIFGFGFLGFTATNEGDLERYAEAYYLKSNDTLIELFDSFINIESSKFIVDLLASLIAFTGNHHIYFAVLFIIYGYFYVESIFLLKHKELNSLYNFGALFFLAFALYFSIRSIISLAFYTGAIFYCFMLLSYIIKGNEKKYLYYSFLVPFFHIGLTPLIFSSLLLLIFNTNTKIFVVVVVGSFIIGQSSVINFIEVIAIKSQSEMLDSKYRSYASESGQKRLDSRYALGAKSSNFKLLILNKAGEVLNFIVFPFSLILVYIKRKLFFRDKIVLYLFNASLAVWSVSNLMLNISQGERFLKISTFITFALLIYIYQKNYADRFLKSFFYIILPILMFFGVGSLYASNKFIGIEFFISNFFISFLVEL